ncbi:MAG: hypothetical protein H6577_18405 [Lewinellaceae bacterium]|nr:hypothetical protein [Saprospiraceae bacterium]MCB9340099.1 hypothetical protein [Lewinellaceae bacterium]
MKKQTGVWIDFKEAYLIDLKGKGEPAVRHILSDIDTSSLGGGSRTRDEAWGPMDKTSESKFLERRKHQESAYFEAVIKALAEAEEVYIFGPAEAKDGLVKAIKAGHNFPANLMGVETADSMTPNQRIAQVRAFFGQRT